MLQSQQEVDAIPQRVIDDTRIALYGESYIHSVTINLYGESSIHSLTINLYGQSSIYSVTINLNCGHPIVSACASHEIMIPRGLYIASWVYTCLCYIRT